MVEPNQMDQFVAWAKRRGFAWVGSEIYGGLGSFYDYGPIGVEMKNRLKAQWWQSIVHSRDNVAGLESAIIMNTDVWRASGHLDNFTDPLVEDTVTHKRYRADQLDDPTKSPDGNPITEPIDFNTMFKTTVGSVEDGAETVYLRPETAQGTFVNFKQVMEASRLRPPFGIAQIGKSFRNEITTGNFTFRTREFEQMELEFFVPESEASDWHDYWVKERLNWYLDLGIKKDHLRLYKHPKAKLSHYSKGTTDIEYQFPWGWGELEGIANRGDYDLTQHQKHSGKDLMVYDEETKQKYLPWVIEPAVGVDRALLALTLEAWQEYEQGRKDGGELETVLAINPKLAAYDAAVLPLVKKSELIKLAEKIVTQLRSESKTVFYDESGSIGRRYRRQDEIGTPVCYTVDFDSIEGEHKGTVTARDRDTMAQKRVKI